MTWEQDDSRTQDISLDEPSPPPSVGEGFARVDYVKVEIFDGKPGDWVEMGGRITNTGDNDRIGFGFALLDPEGKTIPGCVNFGEKTIQKGDFYDTGASIQLPADYSHDHFYAALAGLHWED